MLNPTQLTLDTTIMQSKTVGNIIRILKDARATNNKAVIISSLDFIFEKRDEAVSKYSRQAPNKGKNRTTVESRIKYIERGEDDI